MFFVAAGRKLGRAARAEGELHHPPVEEGGARLDAHRHAHAVGLDEIVAAQQQLHIEVQRLVDAVEVLRFFEPGLCDGGEAVQSIEQRAHAWPVQRVFGVGTKERNAVEVRALEGRLRHGLHTGPSKELRVLVVAGKEFVTPITGQHHLDMFGGQLAHT
ncbi:hypothetical protein D3C71_1597630 [compost metagenome]